MRGSLAKARVLYAPVEEIGGGDRLLRACRIHILVYVFFLVCLFHLKFGEILRFDSLTT